MKNKHIGRRAFLRKTSQAAAALTVSTGFVSAGVPKEQEIDLSDAIPTRVLGKTGAKLPMLGYGGAALPKKWGNPLSTEDRALLAEYSASAHESDAIKKMKVE